MPARQNPLLREYFRRQFYEMHVLHNRQFPPAEGFVEHLVDRQIDRYLKDLREKLEVMGRAMDAVDEAALRLQQLPTSPEARLQWRESLASIEDQAGTLRGMLSYLFTELRSKDSFRARLRKEGAQAAFLQERLFLRRNMGRAAERIHNYFFESENTIQLKDLMEDNMLIQLHHVKEMARELKSGW